MVALPLMFIDIADYAAKNFNVQYTLFSPALTLDFGIKAQQAANRTMPIALQISSYAALEAREGSAGHPPAHRGDR
jgi:hypothetical protein